MKEKVFHLLVLVSFVIFVYGCFEQASHKVARSIEKLEIKKEALLEGIQKAQILQEELRLQVAGFSDPEWIEALLIKNLGVVPEGYTKIYFDYSNLPKKRMCSKGM